jgi:hypothetical protein
MLEEFITLHRDEIISRCRAKVAARSDPPPTKSEIDHGVPVFLRQLIDSLHGGLSSNPDIATTALLHGQDLERQGFTVSQVVHDYGDVCQTITEMAVELGALISASDFRVLNECLDNAIAGAVTEFGREREQAQIGQGAVRKDEPRALSVHIVRNLIKTALVAFQAIKAGTVGVGGSTGTVVHQSLVRALDMMDRSLAARSPLTQGVKKGQ